MCSEGNPNKVRPNNLSKLEIVKLCYQSFLEAFKDLEILYVTFILDKPTKELRKIIKDFPFDHNVIEFNEDGWQKGNETTFHAQIDLASRMAGKVMFLEDDYFFLPKSGVIIDEALEDLEFVTPYDHPGYYSEKEHDYERDVYLIANHHWQSVISTCLTFATHSKFIRQHGELMKKFGTADHPMWKEITKNTYLWSPMPSLATHMETPFLAPIIKWQEYF